MQYAMTNFGLSLIFRRNHCLSPEIWESKKVHFGQVKLWSYLRPFVDQSSPN